jgi:hypothetical protein
MNHATSRAGVSGVEAKGNPDDHIEYSLLQVWLSCMLTWRKPKRGCGNEMSPARRSIGSPSPKRRGVLATGLTARPIGSPTPTGRSATHHQGSEDALLAKWSLAPGDMSPLGELDRLWRIPKNPCASMTSPPSMSAYTGRGVRQGDTIPCE